MTFELPRKAISTERIGFTELLDSDTDSVNNKQLTHQVSQSSIQYWADLFKTRSLGPGPSSSQPTIEFPFEEIDLLNPPTKPIRKNYR